MYVLLESSQMCVSSQSIPLNSAGSSEIVTEGNYILDFVARNSYLLDRQVSSCFSCPNLPYLCETCPIKVQSIFSRHYVFAHLPIHAWSKSNLFLVIGGRCFSRDLPHQRKRWPQPFIIHVMTHTPDPAWPKSNLFMVTGGRWKPCDVLWCCTSKVARRHARACRTYF